MCAIAVRSARTKGEWELCGVGRGLGAHRGTYLAQLAVEIA